MHRMYKWQASQLERGMATGDEELKPGTQTTLVLSSCSIAAHLWPYVSMATGDEELWPTWLKLCARAYATSSRDGSWFFFSNSHFSFKLWRWQVGNLYNYTPACKHSLHDNTPIVVCAFVCLCVPYINMCCCMDHLENEYSIPANELLGCVSEDRHASTDPVTKYYHNFYTRVQDTIFDVWSNLYRTFLHSDNLKLLHVYKGGPRHVWGLVTPTYAASDHTLVKCMRAILWHHASPVTRSVIKIIASLSMIL